MIIKVSEEPYSNLKRRIQQGLGLKNSEGKYEGVVIVQDNVDKINLRQVPV